MTEGSNVYNLFEEDSKYSLDEQLALLAEVVQSFASSLNIDETLHNAIEKFILYLNAEAGKFHFNTSHFFVSNLQ